MMHPAGRERYIGTLSALRLPATDELNYQRPLSCNIMLRQSSDCVAAHPFMSCWMEARVCGDFPLSMTNQTAPTTR
jgi:hypothetical protein